MLYPAADAAGFGHDKLIISPPYVIGDAEIDTVIERFELALRDPPARHAGPRLSGATDRSRGLVARRPDRPSRASLLRIKKPGTIPLWQLNGMAVCHANMAGRGASSPPCNAHRRHEPDRKAPSHHGRGAIPGGDDGP
jgi:hypothetical protein